MERCGHCANVLQRGYDESERTVARACSLRPEMRLFKGQVIPLCDPCADAMDVLGVLEAETHTQPPCPSCADLRATLTACQGKVARVEAKLGIAQERITQETKRANTNWGETAKTLEAQVQAEARVTELKAEHAQQADTIIDLMACQHNLTSERNQAVDDFQRARKERTEMKEARDVDYAVIERLRRIRDYFSKALEGG